MGLGDERHTRGEGYELTAQAMAQEMYPEMPVVPGGSHFEWDKRRQVVVETGSEVLQHLVNVGLLTEEQLQSRYGGER